DEFINVVSDSVFAADISKLPGYEIIRNRVETLQIQVAAPMIVQGSVRGLLILGKKLNGTEFSDENLLFIEALGNSAILAMENERLFREELEKKRIEGELAIALEIQRNLLPDKSPKLNNFEISGTSIPSRHVGGDLYDYVDLGDGRLLVAIADVSGKGIPASLIMANFQAALSALASAGLDLKDILQRINRLLCKNTAPDKFVTSFFCIIDDNTKKIYYINAGHNPPYFRKSDGTITPLTKGGLIIGFLDMQLNYESDVIDFDKDDLLVLYTDGVTEAENLRREEYGEERLKKLIYNINKHSPDECIELIVGDVNEFSSGTLQRDDITLVIIKGK
ncbi:MAG: PP2C family protein-serine/threonine phosphatase, partial [Candidatus Kapabacteria bacterium]|nr:PP2C family protein-serine/threonine phosphatase [Candidatus Kapabacteria bacterium]